MFGLAQRPSGRSLSPRMRSSRPFVSFTLSPTRPPLPMQTRSARPFFSFPSTSGAGRSSLRPSHVRDALRPASSDMLLRLLSEVGGGSSLRLWCLLHGPS